ncbi:uncharacterized protein LOC135494908 [Lineus longissimus]|uniref:uncharacterized protein LOC135494908 n=1 Tax=Lineus longissimus TaxID=88925 RepID=UPI002B4EB4DA
MATPPESKRRKYDGVESGMKALRDALEERGEVLRPAEQLETKLTVWSSICRQLVEKKNALIKEINNHATNLPNQDEVLERYEDEIKEWQADRQAEIEQEFDVSETMAKADEALKVISDIVQKERENPAVIHAKELLDTVEPDDLFSDQFPAQLAKGELDLKIMSSWKDLVEDTVTQAVACLDFEQFHDQLYALHHMEFEFVDLEPELEREYPNFGEFRRDWDTQPKEIFKIKLPVSDEATMYIPCVVDLGELVAVVRPTAEEEESGYIDFYKLTTKIQMVQEVVLTMEFVPPILDMAATPEGHLAILGGHDGDGCDFGITVTSIDPETCNGETFCRFPLKMEKPISLCVTLFHQFVVLCETSGKTEQDESQKQIVVLDKDGVVQHKHVVPEDECPEAGYITRGGRFIFLMPGGSYDNPTDDVCIYEIQGHGIKLVKTLTDILAGTKQPTWPCFLSFSATLWDDLYITSTHNDELFLGKCVKAKGEALEWTLPGHKEALHKVTSNPLLPIERKVCISARNGYLILTNGQTIRRYRQYLIS